ncbi:MAG: endonuclease MutS2 [Clostridia bacterium]|nr:endonuclease MutS2 [Clostridia bacterium]MDH7573737.1 endonuclease MutS2 [Clostridia bacterium]
MITEKTLELLEFPKIRQKLAGHCDTPLGRELALALTPAIDPTVVAARLEETAEAEEILRRYGGPSLSGAGDLRPLLERVGVGGVLGPEELWRVYTALVTIHQLARFTKRLEGDLPRWRQAAEALRPAPELEARLSGSLSPEGEVLDAASPRLAQVRRERRALEARLREKLDSLLRDPATQKFLQDLVVTQRHNRYVLPVKQEYRQRVPGIVHGQSASGATLFIEPMAVVELNNRLRLLEDQEQEEIAAVLAELSRAVGQLVSELEQSLAAVARLDLFLAKARLAREQEATLPLLNHSGRVRLLAARHPLLPKDRVVPIDVGLGEDYDLLIITGPNTGGKTVSLKTVGLLTVMAQAGLFVPAAAGSEAAVFTGIYADIGDEQSIEQSLSTFSSHMNNLVSIINNLELPALVLLDEIGAGTDPAEGAALAQAILEHLRERGAKVMATTHLGELKLYAHQTPRVANAAVEFDAARLVPTYRFRVGLPGGSNALQVAETLGLPRSILEQAREFLGPERREWGELLAELEKQRREYEHRQTEAARRAEELERILRQLEREKKEFEVSRQAALAEARREAQALVRRTQGELKTLWRQFRARLDEEGRRAADRAFQVARQELDRLLPEAQEPSVPTGAGPVAAVEPGSWVWVPKLQQRGQIVAKAGSGEVTVMVGNLRLQLPLSELEALPEQKPEAVSRRKETGSVSVVATREVSPSIMVRGLTTEEALAEVDKYLDEAVLAGLSSVVVIHGKGEGILRAAIHRFLADHPHVKSFRLGGPGEGGIGVTVVNLT